jgi:hypothetical protein
MTGVTIRKHENAVREPGGKEDKRHVKDRGKEETNYFFPSSLRDHVPVVIKREENSNVHHENLKWHGNLGPRINTGL